MICVSNQVYKNIRLRHSKTGHFLVMDMEGVGLSMTKGDEDRDQKCHFVIEVLFKCPLSFYFYNGKSSQ